MADEEKNQREKSQEKLMDSGGLTGEVSQLINKYAGGRIPILVDDEDTRRGLVNGELVRIYQAGFGIENLIPLGILYAKGDCKDKAAKWNEENADYHLNEWSRPYWTGVCESIRSCHEGNEKCEDCDRRYAKLAEREGDVMAYMCVHGMVDFAMPIFVEDQVIAVIFTGQRVPKENSLWNKEFVEEDGVFSLKGCDESGVDARQVTNERFKLSEQSYGLEAGTLAGKLKEDLEKDLEEDKRIEVTPEGVEKLRKRLKEAGHHLSQLAESTYRLEKSKAVAALRSAVARSVADVEVDTEHVGKSLPSIVTSISETGSLICKYFGLDYMLVLNLKSEESSFRVLSEHTPEKSPWKRGLWADELDEEAFRAVEDEILKFPELGEVNLWPLRKLPFFEWVSMWLKDKQASQCVAARLDSAGLPPCVLIAGRDNGFRLSDFRQQDKNDFSQVVKDIGMVMDGLLFIEQLQAAGESQKLREKALGRMTHELKVPLVAIRGATQLMQRTKGVDRFFDYDYPGDVWSWSELMGRLIDNADLARYSVDEMPIEPVPTRLLSGVIAPVIRQAGLLLKERGFSSKNIDYDNDMFRQFPELWLDRNRFQQVFFNLLWNATKYAYSDTGAFAVEIDGLKDRTGFIIWFRDWGTGIEAGIAEAIFEAGVRGEKAVEMNVTGQGFGLWVVRKIIERHGGTVEVTNLQLPTEFKISLPYGLTSQPPLQNSGE